jgi:hypothetical protein
MCIETKSQIIQVVIEPKKARITFLFGMFFLFFMEVLILDIYNVVKNDFIKRCCMRQNNVVCVIGVDI